MGFHYNGDTITIDGEKRPRRKFTGNIEFVRYRANGRSGGSRMVFRDVNTGEELTLLDSDFRKLLAGVSIDNVTLVEQKCGPVHYWEVAEPDVKQTD